jgi:hypothetical protein
MTDRDAAATDELDAAFARLDKLTATVRRHEAAAEAARDAAGQAAVEVMRIGLKLGRKRIRTAALKRSPFSHTTLRSIADAAGIPPDERYARGQAQRAES